MAAPKTVEEWKTVLRAIAPKGKAQIINDLAAVMPQLIKQFHLNTVNRQAHFLGQVAHESDGFRTTSEYASGAAYEGRRNLGNTHKGDGRRFKGRGLIQLTGRANYAAAGKALGKDYIKHPEQVAKFPDAALVSGWFWTTHPKIYEHADNDDYKMVTKVINGSYRHLDRRTALTKRAQKHLG